jgi:hypothetical protein
VTGWFVDGDTIRNPRGEPVATIRKGFSSIKREELREHIEDCARKAVARARYDWEHEHDHPEAWEDCA